MKAVWTRIVRDSHLKENAKYFLSSWHTFHFHIKMGHKFLVTNHLFQYFFIDLLHWRENDLVIAICYWSLLFCQLLIVILGPWQKHSHIYLILYIKLLHVKLNFTTTVKRLINRSIERTWSVRSAKRNIWSYLLSKPLWPLSMFHHYLWYEFDRCCSAAKFPPKPPAQGKLEETESPQQREAGRIPRQLSRIVWKRVELAMPETWQ